jgi:hypothetical protein
VTCVLFFPHARSPYPHYNTQFQEKCDRFFAFHLVVGNHISTWTSSYRLLGSELQPVLPCNSKYCVWSFFESSNSIGTYFRYSVEPVSISMHVHPSLHSLTTVFTVSFWSLRKTTKRPKKTSKPDPKTRNLLSQPLAIFASHILYKLSFFFFLGLCPIVACKLLHYALHIPMPGILEK